MASTHLFEQDSFPGRPRILFIGLAESSHTQAWIDLFEGADFNVRLFALPSGTPPAGWQVRTYLTTLNPESADSAWRLSLPVEHSPQYWLAEVIRSWQPQVIHTLGFDPAGALYLQTRQAYGVGPIGRWVLQLRGGSDIVLHTMNPELAPWIERAIQSADQIIVQNLPALEFVKRLGAGPEKLSSLNPIHGTGGIDVTALAAGNTRPSERRVILVPKGYNSVWSLASPVLEAFQMSWSQLQPCEVVMLASSLDVQMQFRTLPAHIRQAFHIHERIPRSEALALTKRARVVLAPSLVDGFPAVVMEAMATGALPIVSPLDTITPTVRAEDNVLFARNLYPQEIADALVRAMTDDALVDRAAEANLPLIRQFGDRSLLRPRVLAYYDRLATSVMAAERAATPRRIRIARLGRSLVAHCGLAHAVPETELTLRPQRRDLGPAALQIEYEHVFYRCADLDRALGDLRRQWVDVTEQLDRMRDGSEGLRAEYDRSQANLVTLQQQFAELQQEYARTQADLVATQQNLADFQREYALVNEQAVVLKAQIEALRQSDTEAEQQLTALRRQVADVTQNRDDTQAHYESLTDEYAQSQADLETARRNLAELRQEYARSQADQQTTQNNLAELRLEYEHSQRDLVAAQQNLADFQREYALVNEQVLVLRAEIEALKQFTPETDTDD